MAEEQNCSEVSGCWREADTAGPARGVAAAVNRDT